MKRLLIGWLLLCMLLPLPCVAENEPPVPNEPDPDWVLFTEPDEVSEAFASGDEPRLHKGMRPLSRYAQVIEVTDEDLVLAARIAYLEAGGSNERAYRAVLCVLFNRCVAPRFGGEVTDIATEAYRKGQFSVIHHKGFRSLEPPETIVEAARDVFVYGNLDLPENVLFFCASRLGKNWGGRRFYKDIGGNLFFYGRTD